MAMYPEKVLPLISVHIALQLIVFFYIKVSTLKTYKLYLGEESPTPTQ